MIKSKYMSTNNKKRLPWLDIAKGIAMMAVVFSHEFASVKPLALLCNSFMLPLFFMCSGFCLSPGKYGIAEYFTRKAKTLLLPYFVLGLIVSLLHIGINGIDGVLKNIINNLFSWQTLWFLPVLFIADLFLYILLSVSKNKFAMNTIVGLIAVFTGMFFCWQNFKIMMDLAVVPISVFYLTVGFGLNSVLKKNGFSHKGNIGFSLLVIGILLMIITKGNLVLKLNDILPIWKVVFSTMEAIGIMLILSIKITPPRLAKVMQFLEYIGKNTMAVFAFHMPVFFYCQTFIRPFFKSQLYYKPIEFVLIWGVCLILTSLFNQHAPILIGKKHNR